MFESALEAGLSAAGVDIILLGPMPTPAIAYLTKNTRARGGIVISASHNPYYDNGIKFFSADGTKFPDEIELAIEEEFEKPLQCVNSKNLGKATRINDAPRRYIEFCKSQFDEAKDLKGLTVVVDCANGAAYHIAPKVFEELGATVIPVATSPNGFNINAGCGATDTELLRETVVANNADLGIALDGDGDRVIMIDSQGGVVDGDEILYIIARHRKEQLNGGVVGTLMSNFGLEQALTSMGLEFYRSSVGDRYVLEMLLNRDLCLGGESSGHIINLNLTSTGDGIITGLQVLEAMVEEQSSLHVIKRGMDKYPQEMINIRLRTRVNLDDFEEILSAVNETESQLNGAGRVLLRESGTEPLVRVMVEGRDKQQVHDLVTSLTGRVEQALSDYIQP